MNLTLNAQQKAEASLKARKRLYPAFVEGMTVNEYVYQYYQRNAMRWVPTQFGIQRGAYTAGQDIEALRQQVVNFFQPLSNVPQFTPTNEVTCEEEL